MFLHGTADYTGANKTQNVYFIGHQCPEALKVNRLMYNSCVRVYNMTHVILTRISSRNVVNTYVIRIITCILAMVT